MTLTNPDTDATRRVELIAEASQILGSWDSQPYTAPNYEARALSVVQSLYKTALGLPAAVNWAKTYHDTNLTPDGQQKAREDRLAAVTAAVRSRLSPLEVHLNQGLEASDKAAEPYRPKLDLENAAQLARTHQAWESIVLPQLSAGKSWPDVIATLDHDGLLAIERFAPAHEAAKRDKFHQHEVPQVLAELRESSAKRAIDAAPEGPARDALTSHARVSELTQLARYSASLLRDGTANPTGVSTTIKHQTYAAGAQPGASQGQAA